MFCRRDEESASMCDGGDPIVLQVNVEIPEPITRDMSAEQKTGRKRWSGQEWKSGGKLRGSGNVR